MGLGLKYRRRPILDNFKFLLEGTTDIQHMYEQFVIPNLGTQRSGKQTDRTDEQVSG
jgi:hypothetical protein